jgi:hypothetical protein
MGPTDGSFLAFPGAALTIARLRVREGISRPLLPVLAIAAFALIALLPQLVLFGFGREAEAVRDLGGATLRLAALLVALVVGGPLGTGSREEGAEALVLTRPLRPAALVLGRFAGALGLMGTMLTMLSVALAMALKSAGADAAAAPVVAGRTLFEGAVVLAVATAAGEALPRGPAALATLAAFGLGHLVHGAGAAGRALASFLPDLESIGAPVGAAERAVAPGRAALLAALAVLAYLSLAAALAEGREPGRHGSGAS